MAKHPSDRNQMHFDWTSAMRVPPSNPAQASEPLNQATLPGVPRAEPRKARKSPAVLPVPRPLASAVGKGHFGEDERGPIRPKPDEVRAITEHHAEKLIELLRQQHENEQKLARTDGADRKALVLEKDRLWSAYRCGIALYAEDFGEHAANRLDNYARTQYRRP